MSKRDNRKMINLTDDELARVDQMVDEQGHGTVSNFARHLFKEEWKRRGHPDPDTESPR